MAKGKGKLVCCSLCGRDTHSRSGVCYRCESGDVPALRPEEKRGADPNAVHEMYSESSDDWHNDDRDDPDIDRVISRD